MTVRELAEQLAAMPADAEVMMPSPCHHGFLCGEMNAVSEVREVIEPPMYRMSSDTSVEIRGQRARVWLA